MMQNRKLTDYDRVKKGADGMRFLALWAWMFIALAGVSAAYGQDEADLTRNEPAGEAVDLREESRSTIPFVKDIRHDYERRRPFDTSSHPSGGFEWKSALKQSLAYLAIQHTFALATQAKTRHALRGPFFNDYLDSVRTLHGWDDGGRFFTNYVAHPMQGSFLGYLQVQNDPKGRGLRFGRSSAYWKSRMKAMAWSAAWSTQFEIGPISQASIGNVGLKGKQTWGDIVTTPTAGIAMLVTEDALDRYVIRPVENRWHSKWIKFWLRVLLNPTRSVANVFRIKDPAFRDPGLRL